MPSGPWLNGGLRNVIPKFIACLLMYLYKHIRAQISDDFAELFEGGFEVFDGFLREDVRIGKIVGLFEAFVSEPGDVQAGFIAVDEFVILI